MSVRVRLAIQHALTHDSLLKSLVGLDSDGEWKIYEQKAKLDSVAPYIVWLQLDTNTPREGTYGDLDSIFTYPFQVSVWARRKEEAWQIAEAVVEAFRQVSDAELNAVMGNWSVMLLRITGQGPGLEEQATDLFHVPTTFEFTVSR